MPKTTFFSVLAFLFVPILAISVPNADVLVHGTITSEGSGDPIVRAELKFRDVAAKANIIVYTDAEGKYDIKLKRNTTYQLNAQKPDYVSKFITFETDEASEKALSIQISQLESGGIYILDGIQFEINGTNLVDYSDEALFFLSNTLKVNQKAKLNIYLHTDSRGKSEYNKILSEKRAQVIKEKLIQLDVHPSRILTFGYGERFPLNHCSDGVLCNSSSHAMNRRTEISFQDLD